MTDCNMDCGLSQILAMPPLQCESSYRPQLRQHLDVTSHVFALKINHVSRGHTRCDPIVQQDKHASIQNILHNMFCDGLIIISHISKTVIENVLAWKKMLMLKRYVGCGQRARPDLLSLDTLGHFMAAILLMLHLKVHSSAPIRPRL